MTVEVMIDFTEEEQKIAEEYALKQGMTLEEVIKTTFFKKISNKVEENGVKD